MTPGEKKRIVFLVRAFNDIDHFTPLIERVASLDEFELDVFCVNWNYKFALNPNSVYLQKNAGVTLSYLWGGPDSKISERVCLEAIKKVSESVRFFRKRLSRVNKYRKSLEFWLYSILPKDRIFKGQQPLVVIFDWMNAEHPRNRSLVRKCKRLGIPTVCLPHGVWVYSNQFATAKNKLADPRKRLYFDLYPCPGRHTGYLVDRGVPRENILELGSMRYCKKWVDTYQSAIADPEYVGSGKGGLKLVIFLSQSFYNVDNDALSEMISSVAQLPGLDLVIKPHTRGISPEYIQEIVGDNEIRICPEISSVTLISWADAAIVYGSSIAIQVLSQGKVLLYPEFIDSNTVHFSDMQACWPICSVPEMVDVVRSLSDGTAKVPYTEEAVREFMGEIVYAGRGVRDVTQDYLDRIVAFARKCQVVDR
jgi:hypothetical protein